VVAGMSQRTILEENYCPDVLFVRMSARVRVYPADTVLSSADTVVVAGLEREKFFSIFNFQFSIFGFRFSIPKIPELRGRSREKKKVFSA
jgi:hypothetical protein